MAKLQKKRDSSEKALSSFVCTTNLLFHFPSNADQLELEPIFETPALPGCPTKFDMYTKSLPQLYLTINQWSLLIQRVVATWTNCM